MIAHVIEADQRDADVAVTPSPRRDPHVTTAITITRLPPAVRSRDVHHQLQPAAQPTSGASGCTPPQLWIMGLTTRALRRWSSQEQVRAGRTPSSSSRILENMLEPAASVDVVRLSRSSRWAGCVKDSLRTPWVGYFRTPTSPRARLHQGRDGLRAQPSDAAREAGAARVRDLSREPVESIRTVADSPPRARLWDAPQRLSSHSRSEMISRIPADLPRPTQPWRIRRSPASAAARKRENMPILNGWINRRGLAERRSQGGAEAPFVGCQG